MSASIPSTTDHSEQLRLAPLPELLAETVARFGNRPATDFFGKRLTYAELAQLVERAARGFQLLGVRRGTRVGLCLPNTPYSIICYFAILKAGGIVVNFNPLYVEREIAHQIEDSGTTIMVTVDVDKIYPKVAATLGKTCLERLVVCPLWRIFPAAKGIFLKLFKSAQFCPIPNDLRHVSFAQLISDRGVVEHVPIDPQRDLAVLQYTGGTTGVPKGAMLTHANLSANVAQICIHMHDVRLGHERALLLLPLFHVFAMTAGMNYCIAIGAEIVLLPRFNVHEVLRFITKKRPTLFPGVPTLYAALNAKVSTGRYDLSSIRYCISGGAPLPLEVRLRFEQWSGCKLIEGYGLTEASPVVSGNPIDAEPRSGSVGRPFFGTIVEIRSLENPSLLMPIGEKGEVCLRGPQIMAAYWNNPAETTSAFIDGALRTGDVGYVDADGFLFLVDRLKDIILCGGYNIYPRVVEEALYQHGGVAEAAVIGVPDVYRGQVPIAFVTLRADCAETATSLLRFLKDYLSPIEMPKSIAIRATLPKTAIGKIDRKVLIEEERERREAAEVKK
ncbi:long-chain fatty acid--CoA ligase [Methylovirgula sp. HY1]|uniref:long-chain-fatty-acid--CoA ligase n=1 Tax=Methylovirgula sp. HY1 TaxID=2822761 RepID=UPI001C5A8BE1|nr:long-chain fatty acid--CoA ligase [Methylovirgula sp. HY1]